MITKIQFSEPRAFKYHTQPAQPKPDSGEQKPAPYNSGAFYYVSFTGKIGQKDVPASYEEYQQFDNAAVNIISKATNLAKKYNHKQVTQYHFMSTAFGDTIDYIDKLNSGKADLYIPSDGEGPSYFTSLFSKDLFENPKYRAAFREILLNEKQTVDSILSKLPKRPEKSRQRIKVSELFYNDVENSRESQMREETIVNGFDIYNGAFNSVIPEYKNFTNNFRMKVNDVLMLENHKDDERMYFPNYDKKAETVMKNLNLGTNMFITYDNEKVNPNYFMPALLKAFQNSGQKLNPENTEIIEFNKNVEMAPLILKLRELVKDKDKNHIVIFSQFNLARNAIIESDGQVAKFMMPEEYINFIKNTPKNLRLVVFDAKDNYLSYLQNAIIANAFKDFGEITIPVLNSGDVLNAFIDDKGFLDKSAKNISKKALEKIVNTSSQIDGILPDKTFNLMKKISSCYIDKKEITVKDVDDYIKEADYLFKQTNNDSSVEIVFDTGKRLKDIIGKSNTKKEAESLVRQIKNKKTGTKGFILYSQDGMAGGGRRHTAEAIAGEANIPFVAINTLDFGTKDVDLFGGLVMSPEASIKKIFSLASTQAEANPHKAAMLFIENFEYFSVGEMVSEYHQKAMAQLIREMENAQKKGLNIVVMGSVSNPDFIGEAAMKSFKFNDNIEISSPAFNKEERFEILKYILKKNRIKVAGSKEEQESLLKDISKTLRGFSFIELKSFIKKAESIAQERNHKEITKADMTESYLRLTTGRPAAANDMPHEKEIVARHECGHAVTLQVMNNLFKNHGKPWHIPDTVNFITLDPRSYYGGAMYPKIDSNTKFSFEKAFSDIVCSYGGHSAEKYFYDMDGSWGITGDLDNVTSMAENMVKVMGQGFYTGKISLANRFDGKDYSRIMTDDLRNRVSADVMVITRNALTASDFIVSTYADFIKEFSDKYAPFVGTGDCLVDGDTFRKELAEWKARQPKEVQNDIEALDRILLDIIVYAKNGKIY